MQDTSLYEAVLGLEDPWEVVEVRLQPAEEKVEVVVRATEKSLPCSLCGASSPRYDHRSRRWRHLETCQFQTFLHLGGLEMTPEVLEPIRTRTS